MVPPFTLFDEPSSSQKRLSVKQCEEWHLCRRSGDARLVGWHHPGLLRCCLRNDLADLLRNAFGVVDLLPQLAAALAEIARRL